MTWYYAIGNLPDIFNPKHANFCCSLHSLTWTDSISCYNSIILQSDTSVELNISEYITILVGGFNPSENYSFVKFRSSFQVGVKINNHLKKTQSICDTLKLPKRLSVEKKKKHLQNRRGAARESLTVKLRYLDQALTVWKKTFFLVWPASLHSWYGVPPKKWWSYDILIPHSVVLLYNACSRFRIIFSYSTQLPNLF